MILVPWGNDLENLLDTLSTLRYDRPMTDTLSPSAANVLAVYNSADAESIREGLSWYLDAYNFARILDSSNPSRAAGVIAAMSPMMGWEMNKRVAEKIYAQGNAKGCGLKRNCEKAERIFNGEDPLDVLSGDKVRAFYRTILSPAGLIEPVIDRHAFDIAVGQVTDDKARGILSRKGMYNLFANVYIEAATIAGISSSQMQAITWVAWRKIKGIA